jgi:hypothetical protein
MDRMVDAAAARLFHGGWWNKALARCVIPRTDVATLEMHTPLLKETTVTTLRDLRNPSATDRSVSKRLLLTAATCAILCSTLTVRAAESYNPDRLGPDQLARVSGICETVMGLNPAEPLESGYWIGNARLDSATSHYRGCVLALSDSLQRISEMRIAREADNNCRAQGFESGSADLALCTLTNRRLKSDAAQSLDSIRTATKRSPTVGSFFYTSPRELNLREESACASLGLESGNGSFDNCVKSLKDTFYTIDHPVN